MADARLEIEATLRDKASGKLATLRGKVGKLGGAIGGVLRKGAIGAGVAVGALAVKSVMAFASFDEAMTKSLAIMGDVSETMRESMSNAARRVAKVTTFSAKEAAEAYFYLASAGLSAEQSIAALPKVAAFAQAGNFDLATATDLLTDAQSALGLTVDDTEQNIVNMVRTSDALIKANTLSNATAQQFSEALTNKAGPALRATNKDVEEGLAVLGVFADQGIKGAEAGTKFGIALRDLQTKALANKDEFAALNISVFDSKGEMRNMADIVGDLEGALGGMSTAQKKATLLQLGFSDKSVSVIQALLGTSEQIRDYEASLRDAGGITQEVKEKQLESFTAQMSLLKSAFMDVLITLGGLLVPALLKLLPVLQAGSEALQGFISGFERFNDPDVTSKGAFGFGERLFVVFRQKVYPALKAIADFLRRDFFPPFLTGLRTLRQALEPVVRFILNNKPALIAAITAVGIAILLAFGPGAMAIAAIIGLIALIGLVRENFDAWEATVTEFVDKVIAKIEEIPVIGLIFKATVRVIRDKIQAVISYIKNLIAFGKELIRFFKAVFSGDWAAAWDSLKRMAQIALRLFLDWLQLTFYGTLKSVFASIVPWDWVKDKFTGAKGFVKKVTDTIGSVPGKLLAYGQSFANAGAGLFKRLANGAVDGMNALIATVEGGINAIIRKWNSLSWTLPSISTPFGKIGGQRISTPDIGLIHIPRVPKLHAGGVVTKSGLAEVQAGEVYTRGPAGLTVVFQHTGPLMGNDAEARQFARQIGDILRRDWRGQHA